MGKGKRKRERARRRGARRPGDKARKVAEAGFVLTELEQRPEHKAQMTAWRAAGCPVNGGV